MKGKQLFAPIHDHVTIAQKIVDYRPSDKLVFAAIGFIAGAETVYNLNQILRPNRPLLNAFIPFAIFSSEFVLYSIELCYNVV